MIIENAQKEIKMKKITQKRIDTFRKMIFDWPRYNTKSAEGTITSADLISATSGTQIQIKSL